ncbi:hypothetical protein Tco_1056875 [Tanacetum coccineum]|uniref:Reverse transcriptase Ty1/copia-type domain-containing protein n=1 Tax=Tanacetum coccineum TaxID=301880 RepID=A0ABQ5H3S1_9ASTR
MYNNITSSIPLEATETPYIHSLYLISKVQRYTFANSDKSKKFSNLTLLIKIKVSTFGGDYLRGKSTWKLEKIKDCRVMPRNVNPVNVRNLAPARRACYEYRSTDHLKPACPSLNRAQGPRGNRLNQVVANNEGQGHGNQGNQARGGAFMLGAEEARQDPNIVTGMNWLSNHKAEIICHEKVARIPLLDGKVLRVLGERPEEKARLLMSAKASDKKKEEIVVLIPEAVPIAKSPYHLAPSELEELSGQLKELQDKDSRGACRTLKVSLGTAQVGAEEHKLGDLDIRAIRILIAIAAFYDYEIWQMDVKTAFLNGYLNEEKILKRFYMENSKRGTISMQEKLKLSKSEGASTLAEIQRMQNILYALAVGLIMYVVRCTRLDVAFTQNITSRFQHNPDAEYIAAFDASKEAVWIRKFISGLGVVPTIEEPINMYCDNTGAIAIAKDHEVTKGARHFHAKVHYL